MVEGIWEEWKGGNRCWLRGEDGVDGEGGGGLVKGRGLDFATCCVSAFSTIPLVLLGWCLRFLFLSQFSSFSLV